MRDYAVNDYGLLLTRDTLKFIASKVCKDYTSEDYDNDESAFNDELYDKGIAERISDFTGEAFAVDNVGQSVWYNSIYFDFETIWYAPAKRISMLFKAAYSDANELIEEFKKNIGSYLPDDFDYRNNIRHISGTYYG
jgi:hypothetical protein